MVAAGHRARGWWLWVGRLVLLAIVGVQQAYAQDGSASPEPSRLRPMDRKAAGLLEAGKFRSATFRRLADSLERSDLIVWVATGHLQRPGQLQFIAATPRSRCVRVAVRLPGLENGLVSTLAHELQHAVEIAGASEIRDQASLRRFYERIGEGRPAGVGVEVETAAAQRIGMKVLNELLAAGDRREGRAPLPAKVQSRRPAR
jgi:hypothetical protein